MFSLNLSGSGAVLFVSIMCKYRMIFWFMESLLYIYTVLWKSWKFLAFTGGNWEPCWGIRVWVLVFCLSRPPKWAYWGTNHKYSTCFLKKLSIYFPEKKTRELEGRFQVISRLLPCWLWDLVLVFHLCFLFCSFPLWSPASLMASDRSCSGCHSRCLFQGWQTLLLLCLWERGRFGISFWGSRT